jgi:iron complex outermembrane receptor protein
MIVRIFVKARPVSVGILMLKLAVGFAVAATATNDPVKVVPLPPITVFGDPFLEVVPLSSQQKALDSPTEILPVDAADLIREAPGAAVVRNGPLTGIVQLRGMQNERVRILVDGMTLTPACPNHMDPPMHYANPTALETVTVVAGITPVSQGGDSLAGTVRLDSAPPRFATNQNVLGFVGARAQVETANRGFGVDGKAGVANRKLSASYAGAWMTAEDYRFPGGIVRATGYTSQNHRMLLGAQTSPGILTLDVGLGSTRDAGTPALPMDMIEDDSTRLRGSFQRKLEAGELGVRGYYHDIDHLMDNFTLRPAGMMRMFSPATSQDFGGGVDLELPAGEHRLGTGLEFHGVRFDAYQENAANGLRQDSFNEIQRDRIGGYVEWRAAWHSRWETLLGVRSDGVLSDAGRVEQAFPPSSGDQAAFNASDRSREEFNIDATATVRYRAHRHLSLEAGYARKSRAPSIVQRYLWTPLSASAGQADGRRYLGDLNLNSETSDQVGLTLAGHGTNWLVRVTPFYQWVQDYIQGTPIARLDPLGRPVLQFQNQDRVELYGIEANARYQPFPFLALRGQLGYVRGRNLSTDDNLYRIAPLRGTVALDHFWGVYRGTVEVVLVDSQDQVSRYNSEPSTPGYALLNLQVRLALHRNIDLSLALNNVFDERYADHLGGINSVMGSDVPVGERIPGMGRSLITQLGVKF